VSADHGRGGDLQALQRANAHFSPDLLSSLLNEPIPGHAIVWSSASGQSYPISVRVLSFEAIVAVRDPDGSREPPDTFARQLKRRFREALSPTAGATPRGGRTGTPGSVAEEPGNGIDVWHTYIARVVAGIKKEDRDLLNEIRSRGVPWRGVQNAVVRQLPDVIADRDDFAYKIMRPVLDQLLGEDRWHTERRPRSGAPQKSTTWIVAKE